MSFDKRPMAVLATDVAPRTAVSFYPEPFASRMNGREKRQLGEFFGLKNFGVNLTRLAPNTVSSLRHAHAKQDEFIYVVAGEPTLVTNEGRMQLSAGMCVGFRAGTSNAHHLRNETTDDVMYLEVGDRTPGEEVTYPDDDLQIVSVGGKAQYLRKNGSAY